MTFSKILIANRGEIALRVIRTARKLGYRTVAVFSDADRAAAHVRLADEAVHIGGSAAAESYLCVAALLEAARKNRVGKFVHVGTDEVYGSLGKDDPAFSESRRYEPNSPYSASKAASDHLVRAYHHTYGLPVLTTNCSNNYGPYHFPEKLIPLMIVNALAGKPLPVYGDGRNPGRRSRVGFGTDQVLDGHFHAADFSQWIEPQSG